MLAAFLALGLSGVEVDSSAPRSCVLYVRTTEDWAPLRSGPVDREIVPLNSRSERVPCAAITKDGIVLRLWAGDVPLSGLESIRVEAVEHALDEIVVQLEGERWILGPAVLPRTVRRGAEDGADVVPILARVDGNSIQLSELWLPTIGEADDSKRWALIGESIEGFFHNPKHAVLTPTAWRGRSSALRLDASLDKSRSSLARIDRIVEAAGRRIPEKDLIARRLTRADMASAAVLSWAPWRSAGPQWPVIRVSNAGTKDVTDALTANDDVRISGDRGSLVEARFEAPLPTAEGRTWTLLVSLFSSEAFPPMVDAPRGPTAGDETPPIFVDESQQLGIEMVHFEGPDLQLDIRPTMGPGAACGDVDGDGWVDLFLPQGGGREGSEPPTSRFFRNDGGKRFVDESASRGLAHTGAGMGALFYDADGDGDLDLFVANYGKNRFLLNDGKGVFTDASAAVGLDSDLWHAAVSAADYDGDGDLDLYVTSYLRYDTSSMPSDEELGRYQREDPVEMLPFAFPGERKLLLRCDLTPAKDGAPASIRYVDVAKELGVDDPNGRGMQAVWWDFDQDGDQDLYLANDVSPNRFWRNEGGGKLKDVGFSTGLDDPRGSMGLAIGDVDGDLDEDAFVTNWQLDMNALYVNNLRHTSAKSRVSTFRDRAVESGIAAPSVGVTGWGAELADFDLDGDLDLFYANGYTSPDYESTGICVGQPCHYLENDGAGNFTPAFEKAGPDVAMPLAARAAIACDYDQDGDLDVAVTANNGRFRLLNNHAPRGKNHWLGLRLRGAGANTHAIGARVVVEAGGRKLLRSLRAGTSYLCGNAPELHFGLGEATTVTSCTIRWPSGKESTHAIEHVDRIVTIAEPR